MILLLLLKLLDGFSHASSNIEQLWCDLISAILLILILLPFFYSINSALESHLFVLIK